MAVPPQGDVTAEDFAGDVVKAAVQRFGRLDILVNNAGGLGGGGGGARLL